MKLGGIQDDKKLFQYSCGVSTFWYNSISSTYVKEKKPRTGNTFILTLTVDLELTGPKLLP